MELLTLIGSVALLMYGMKVMSEGLQKMAGSKLSNIMSTMTTNRFSGVLTGIIISSSIQSSTATTVMVVSFVNAALLTLSQAISVVMGANIGTTITAWIMVLGVSFDIRMLVYSLIVIAIFLIYSKKHLNFGEFLMGFAILNLNATEINLGENESVLGFLGSLSGWGYGSYLLFILIGGLLTCAVQSSSAIMAITMTLCSTGVLPIDMGFALVLGENVGTTITSNVVAMKANLQAKRAARAHLLFNLIGVTWVMLIFPYFVDFICNMVGCDPHAPHQEVFTLNAALAAFHTMFNVCNMLILIWLIKPLEKLVCMMVPQHLGLSENEEMKLRFIEGGPLSTAELSILEARKEINVFVERCIAMFNMARELLHVSKGEEFNRLYSRIEKYESITDRMEVEIARYLELVSEGRLSVESKMNIQRMVRVCSELESIGDSCFNLGRTISRKRQHGKEDFADKQYQHIHSMMSLVSNALELMANGVASWGKRMPDINLNYNIEHEINNYRVQLKNQNMQDIKNNLYDYQMGVFYMDIISECEKVGDYVINVIEALEQNMKKD